MSVLLSEADARRLAAASQALLSPPASGDPRAWWGTVEEPLRALFVGANAVCSTPGAEGPNHFSTSADPQALRTLDALGRFDPRTGKMVNGCPITEAWIRYRRAHRVDLWNNSVYGGILGRRGLDVRRSEWRNDGILAAGLHDFGVMASDAPGSELFITVGYSPGRHSRFGDVASGADLTLLSLLLPSLQTGHRALMAARAHRHALAGTLDASGTALVVVGADGRELHRTTAATRALAGEPDRERLLALVRHMAHELRLAQCGAPRAGTHGRLPPAAACELTTAVARWTLRATHADERLWGAPGVVLVSLESTPLAPEPAVATRPAIAAALRARGLTQREIEVASLLARRLTTNEIAAALGVSPHTARHHTERVLSKLGVHSRRGLAAALSDGTSASVS